MAKYVYDITKDADLKKILLIFDEYEKVFKTKKFKNFIANKCIKELRKIMSANLNNFGEGEEHSVFKNKLKEYKKNNIKEIGDDYILIYNETILTQEEMTWVSEKTRSNYPNGISISKIIEYGTGLQGTSQDDWQVNVNNHNSSWSYKDPDNEGRYKHTSGIEGRFIYYKLLQSVEENFEQWVLQYWFKLANQSQKEK